MNEMNKNIDKYIEFAELIDDVQFPDNIIQTDLIEKYEIVLNRLCITLEMLQDEDVEFILSNSNNNFLTFMNKHSYIIFPSLINVFIKYMKDDAMVYLIAYITNTYPFWHGLLINIHKILKSFIFYEKNETDIIIKISQICNKNNLLT